MTLCALGYQLPPQKHLPLICEAPPPPALNLNLKTIQAPFLANSPLYWFFVKPIPLKIEFFSELP